MRIEGDIVWVKAPIGETMVKRIAGDIADELGLTIKRCKKIPSSFPVYDGPPATPAERAGMVAGLRAMSKALTIQRPRHISQDDWSKQLHDMAEHARKEAEKNHAVST
jgi:hypothetical protein